MAVPISLYVHIPWCLKKCPYCDFSSKAVSGPIPEEAYLSALIADLGDALGRRKIDRFVSVFFGGGTPSLLKPATVGRLLDELCRRGLIDSTTEITLEANPGAAERERFSDLAAAGVNRLSLGVQSFSSPLLESIGRIHDGREAQAALTLATAVFERVSIDLMYGLPSQTLADIETDLAILSSAGIGHASLYQLTIEPGAAFAGKPPTLPDEETIEAIEEAIESRLEGEGLARYEVSAFAKPGQRCRHNLNYWRFGDYLGIGSAAHSKITADNPTEVLREVRKAAVGNYIKSPDKVETRSVLSEYDRLIEAIMNAARLTGGFDLDPLADHARLSPSAFAPAIAHAVAQGYWKRDGNRIRPTILGRRFLNRLLRELL